ncbi:MAG: NADH-quinone oxidoreductase subunit NuoF [Deltaproteobacteria bacterium]|nr:NADH-quinone oxidoreductase subunit NuoF [Deltaproteobacteria bacterium]
MAEKVLFKNVEDPKQYLIETSLKKGGYESLKKALGMIPDEIIDEVKAAGIRGRGGAGFPTGLKWSFIPKFSDQPKYVCCNADEGEPGTFKDRVIIENDPHLLLEGICIAGYAIGAKAGYIYIRGEFAFGAKRLEKAIEEAYKKGLLGKNVFGKGFDFDIYVHRGAGAYICGEETALIDSIEGKRGMPRIKPPFPALAGLYDGPTIVNNVETLSAIPFIVRKGGKAFGSIGPEKSPGTKIFNVSGHVEKPGSYELPMGTPLREIIYEHAGGIKDGKKLKAVIPGGASTPVLTPDEIDVNMDFDSVAAIGSMMGSGAIIVMDESTCIVKSVLRLAKFFAHESCGKCSPCREGCTWMVDIIKDIEEGKGKEGDIDFLLSVSDGIFGNTFCPLGDGASMMVTGAINKFRDEFEYHIKNKKCLSAS